MSSQPGFVEEPPCLGDGGQEGRDCEASLTAAGAKLFEALASIFSAPEVFAPHWNAKRLVREIDVIRRYYRSNSAVVPLATRRKIARNAKALLESLEEVRGPNSAALCGLDPAFESTLRDLATPGWRTGSQDLQQPGDGRMLKGSLAAMIVRLYIEAHKARLQCLADRLREGDL